MNHAESQIEAIEISIEEAKAEVEKRDMLFNLLDNNDFKKLVIMDYLEKEPARLAKGLADQALQGEEQQNNMLKALQAVGYLNKYFSAVIQRGEQAKKAIHDSELAREDIINEEAERVA